MSLIHQSRPVHIVLTQASSFPYTLDFEANGFSAINTGTGTITVTMGNGEAISIPAGSSFDDYFEPFTTITVSGGTEYQIAVR